MSRVNLIGVIMPENLWLEDNVASLDAFKNEIAQCTDSLELYIDSPGGDVFTANAMSTLIAEWCLSHPNAKPTCKIGGLCASAAFNIVAKLPSSFAISCFEDSLFMAHSAYAMITGGPESLRDNAVLLDLVNSVVIDKLLAKTTLDEQRVRNAFREGRELWLSGKEAVACGLVNEILGGQADTTVITATFKHNANAEAYKYAACVTNTIRTKLEAHMAEENKPTVEETETKAEAEVTMEAKAEVVAEAVELEEDKEEAKAECGDNETETKAEDEVEKDDIEEEVEKEEKDDDDTDEIEALKAENASLKAEVESLKAIVAKYQPTATPSAKATNADWMTLVRELNAKHLPEQEYAKAYIALKQTHQHEFDAFMVSHSKRSF